MPKFVRAALTIVSTVIVIGVIGYFAMNWDQIVAGQTARSSDIKALDDASRL